MLLKNNSKVFYALSIAWQLGFLIAFPITGFLFLGLLGDRYFGTEPVFLILGIVVGVTITFYEIYHMLVPLIKERHYA